MKDEEKNIAMVVRRTVLFVGALGSVAGAFMTIPDSHGVAFLAVLSGAPYLLAYYVLRRTTVVIVAGVFMVVTTSLIYLDAFHSESSTIAIRLAAIPLNNVAIMGLAIAGEAIWSYIASYRSDSRQSIVGLLRLILPVTVGAVTWLAVALTTPGRSEWTKPDFWIPLTVVSLVLGVLMRPGTQGWQVGLLTASFPIVASLVRGIWFMEDPLFMPLVPFPYVGGGFVLALVTFIVQNLGPAKDSKYSEVPSSTDSR